MQYDLELEVFDGRAWKTARRDMPFAGTVHDAVGAAEKLFKDSAEGAVIPFACRVVEHDSGQLVAVVGIDRASGYVLTTTREDCRSDGGTHPSN